MTNYLNNNEIIGVCYLTCATPDAVLCESDDIMDFVQDVIDGRTSAVAITDIQADIYALEDGEALGCLKGEEEAIIEAVEDVHYVLKNNI